MVLFSCRTVEEGVEAAELCAPPAEAVVAICGCVAELPDDARPRDGVAHLGQAFAWLALRRTNQAHAVVASGTARQLTEGP